MKKLMLSLSLSGLLAACAGAPQHLAETDPSGYGLFVAATNVLADSTLMVQQQGREPVEVKIRHPGHSDTGYVIASLPPGRYNLLMYSPDGHNNYPIPTENGWFEVQAGCFNYGGDYQFSQGDDGMPHYTNTTTLVDIQAMPSQYKDLAKGRDLCDAGMGHPGERLKAEDVAKVMPDL